jgi:hypothetical protein
MKPPREAECAPPETFPAKIWNRPSLERIAYRIGGYSDVRNFLLRRVDQDRTLGEWTYRGADDPGIALYESASILVDLLTLYQEAYSNEAYLRTATWRESVADLVRLTGYRLKPAIGGTGMFAVEAEGAEPVSIPAGTPINADLADNPETASFETATGAVAFPWLSRIPLVRPEVQPQVENGQTKLVVSQPGRTFAKNDRLLVGVPSDDGLSDWEIVVVDAVATWHGRAVLTLKTPLARTGGHASLTAYKLARTFHHFGHNAPRQLVTVDGSGNGYGQDVDLTRDFRDKAYAGGPGADAFPTLTSNELALEPQVNDLALGTRLALQITVRGRKYDEVATTDAVFVEVGGVAARVDEAYYKRVEAYYNPWTTKSTYLYIRSVTDVRAVTARYGAISGPATVASIDRAIGLQKTVDLRDVLIDTIDGEPFEVGAPWHATFLANSGTLAWWGDAAQAQTLKGRAIAIAPATGPAYTATVNDVVATSLPDLTMVVLDRKVPLADFSPTNPTTVVFGNLVDATEGKTKDEAVLGNGDEQLTFQTFKLPKDPLTYLAHPELTPPVKPEITIVVGERIWKLVPTLYGQPPDAEVYIVRQDHTGSSWIQFGDGKTGARLPSGIDNVRVRWRVGAGAFGPMKKKAQPSLARRIDGVKAVALPGAIQGGAAAETADVARVAAPGRVQSLDRLVSLADIEAETLALGGVERARAAWAIVDGIPCIQVTVLMQAKRTADLASVEASLATANRQRGPARYPIDVIAGAFEYLYLDISVTIVPSYDAAPVKSAVEAALVRELSNRTFGEAEYATRLEGAAQNVPGVEFVVVSSFGSLGVADDPATLEVPVPPARAETVSCAPTHLLRLAPGPTLIVRVLAGGAR